MEALSVSHLNALSNDMNINRLTFPFLPLHSSRKGTHLAFPARGPFPADPESATRYTIGHRLGHRSAKKTLENKGEKMVEAAGIEPAPTEPPTPPEPLGDKGSSDGQ